MSRRASSSIRPFWIIIVFVLLAFSLAGGFWLYSRVSDPYRTVSPLDVKVYLDNSNSLRGNTYKVTATISSLLAWSPTQGRLFSVDVDSETKGEVIPVLIPPEFNQENLQKGQVFIFRIEVGENGVLKARDFHKS